MHSLECEKRPKSSLSDSLSSFADLQQAEFHIEVTSTMHSTHPFYQRIFFMGLDFLFLGLTSTWIPKHRESRTRMPHNSAVLVIIVYQRSVFKSYLRLRRQKSIKRRSLLITPITESLGTPQNHVIRGMPSLLFCICAIIILLALPSTVLGEKTRVERWEVQDGTKRRRKALWSDIPRYLRMLQSVSFPSLSDLAERRGLRGWSLSRNREELPSSVGGPPERGKARRRQGKKEMEERRRWERWRRKRFAEFPKFWSLCLSEMKTKKVRTNQMNSNVLVINQKQRNSEQGFVG